MFQGFREFQKFGSSLNIVIKVEVYETRKILQTLDILIFSKQVKPLANSIPKLFKTFKSFISLKP